MEDFESKAQDFERQADSAAFGWGLVGSKANAAELYENAANAYKLAKSCQLCSLGAGIAVFILRAMNATLLAVYMASTSLLRPS